MRRLILILAALLAAGAAQANVLMLQNGGGGAPVNAYYLAPGGVDAGACTQIAPCATPSYVQTKMRGSGVKNAYFLPGSYTFGAQFTLTSVDSNTYWGGAPGQAWNAATISGGGAIESAICIRGASGVTVNGLKITNVRYGGVMIHGGAPFGPNDCTKGATVDEARGNVVSHLEVATITVPDDSRYADTGGVLAQGDVPGTIITNLLVTDSNGMCVRTSADGGTDDISGTRIVNSVFLRCMQKNGDGGAMYSQDYTGNSTDILISNNYAKDYGNSTTGQVRCFYGDASSSQITFTQNICGAPGSWAVDGNAAVIFLCGKNNVVSQNIFDLGPTGRQITYQYGGCGAPAVTTAMTGNVFTGNIVLGSFASAQTTNWAGWSGSESFYSGGAQPAYPKITSNLYWNYSTGLISTAGVVMPGDQSPIRADPLCTGGMAYNIDASSIAFAYGYAAPARGWGPSGYVLPTSGGAASSCGSAIVADIWLAPSPAGVDSGGTTIGADCTSAAPCATPAKAAAMLAANVTSNASRNYKVRLKAGTYFVASTLLLNSTHTAASAVWEGEPGAVISAGVDTAGTWSSTTLTNGSGVAACVSTALASYAPLVDGTTTTTADRYVGDMWIGGRRVQPPIWPRIGVAPDVIGPLLTVGTATGSYVQGAPTATFTNGSASIGVSDLTQIGIVGDTVAIEADAAGFSRGPRYWILSKSAATGAGAITVSTTQGGSAKTATAGGSVTMAQRTLPSNLGQRYSVVSDKNSFPVGAGYNSAKGDGKVWLHAPQGSGSSLIPIASATSTQVNLQSSAFTSGSSGVYAGQRLRRWNVWEDLGAEGATGEMWTDRTTGLIYYVPIGGETCASLNVAGRTIIPGRAESILRISSATNDGSASGATVGNMVFANIAFRNTNTSVWTGRHNLAGSTGGYIGAGNSFTMMTLEPAIAMVGASNVLFYSVEASHLGGTGFAIGWGSNHVSLKKALVQDAGGAGVVAGADLTYVDNYHFNADNGYVGTRVFGPSTPSFNNGGGATNKDLTAASDCCVSITNSKITDVGRVHTGSACISGPLWQKYSVENNLISDCPNGAIQMTSITAGNSSTPGWVSGVYPGILAAQSYGSTIRSNLLQYAGYGFALDGTRVPGANMAGDFGLLYIQGPQDGPADGSVARLQVSGNVVHDISSSCYSFVSATGTIMARGFDANGDYHDGNSTNGVDEYDNLFFNSATVDGRATCPNRLTQHTGDLRVSYRRNIWAGAFPAGSTVPSLYSPRADVGPYPYLPFRSTAYTCSAGAPCYTINQGWLYKATASGATGSSGAEPACAAASCTAADGSMTWTGVQAMPGVNATDEQSNITAWSITGGGNADYPQRGSIALYPQFTSPDKNLYWQSGKTMVNYSASNGTVSWAAWQAAGKDVNSAWNTDPNFVDMSGASGWAGFKFKATGSGAACGGTGGVSPACAQGFVPYDFSAAGPSW